METGIKAWIANQDPHVHTKVDLPGGYYWDIDPGNTGYLKGPQDELYVGYDLNEHIIQFGADGRTFAPGLNLWTVQEMGEKFVRDNFMDKENRAAYDQFSDERTANRREYEKGVRAEMSGMIQLELSEGEWTAHVDTDKVKQMSGLDVDPEMTREQGIALFNRVSEIRNTMPLRDPLGYMTADDNLYNYIKDAYDFQYNDTIDSIDAGFINGNGRGCEKILDNLDKTVKKNVREYCLPDGVLYQDLRHVVMNDDLQGAVDEFVKQRVTKTVNFEKKRSHDKDSLARDHEKFLKAGETLRETISNAVLPPLDVSLGNDKDINIGKE